MKTVKIGKATQQDIPTILQLWVELIEYHNDMGYIGGFIYKPDRYEDLKKKLEKEIVHEKFLILVAKTRNEVVGFAKANIMTYPTFFKDNIFCMVGQIYVKQQYRGQGIGRQMMQSIEKWAKHKKIHQVRLGMNAQNQKGMEFYQRIGFKPVSITFKKEI